MNSVPLVSICTTTYNREKFIGEAIESCMSQKTTFAFEMVISDNCSEDNTVAIIKEYIEKYPGKIRLLTSDKNYGLMINYAKCIEAANGKYIADCDGDDYWIDEYKLQKQVDFLETHPDFVMCFTNTYIRNSQTGEEKIAKINIWDECGASELIHHNGIEGPKFGEVINAPGHVSSIVFRNHVVTPFPEWFVTCYINDEPLFLMLAKHGKAKFINECSTVYRSTPTGISTFGFSFETDYKGRIDFYKKLKKYYNGELRSDFNTIIATYLLRLSKHVYADKKQLKSYMYIVMAMFYDFKSIVKISHKIKEKRN